MTGSREEARHSGAARMAVRQRCDAECVNGNFIEPLEWKTRNNGRKQMTPYSFNQFISYLCVRKSGYCRWRTLAERAPMDASFAGQSLRTQRVRDPVNRDDPKGNGRSG
ncbi:hypothetical protein [Burkholderia sp. JKS000303]|uniref:hypothetical protein n=1 Tax=Burkholderia sp. JKS000303 TaxID=1938747 RepID=UPI0011814559|nr:hypothetical protein [Burkholderia sp. JKS000303]